MKPSLIFTEMYNQLAEDFIKQSRDYLRGDDCKMIEDAIFQRDLYDEDTGLEYSIYFGEDYLGYISQEWWEKFGDLSNKEQEEVIGYIQDLWGG